MAKTSLHIGDMAPDFSLKDVEGHKVRLKDYKNKYVLVAFLRYSGCPWCNLAVHRLTLEHQLLKDNKCEVVVFIQSSSDNIAKNIIQRHKVAPNFPIIADPDMKMYKKYFVKPSVGKALKHAIQHVPSWVSSVYKEGYKQVSPIDGNLFVAPASFIISRDTQKIVRIDYDADFYDHQSFTDIYESIAHHQIYGFTEK